MTKHTQLPWVCHSGSIYKDGPNVWPKGLEHGIPIARMDREKGNGTLPVERDENARFITLAVNSHERLVQALEEAYNWVGRRTPRTGKEHMTLAALDLRHSIRMILKEVKHGPV